ncbi:MAG: Omp28-related outer membrane protein [Flavobacteriales bacterium]
MNKIPHMKYKLIIVVVSMLILSCCDVIDNPVIDYGSYDNETYGPPPEFNSLGVPVQKVLLEDFTGHDCGNCPTAHIIAKDILENDEEHVALVAVHAGSLAEPFGINYPDDWRTPEGEYYLLTQIGTDLLPTGRVNRNEDASDTFSPSNWPVAVESALDATPPVDMQIEAEYVEANQDLNVHVHAEWFSALAGDFNLVIMIVEDSIVAPQLNYSADPEYIPDYLHMHMLRGTISGATGLPVASNPAVGASSVSSFTYTWNTEWIPEHITIMSVITRGENGEVLNVTKKKLIE